MTSNEKLMQSRSAALGAMSPRERGHQKMLKALGWVYRWGWSSPSVIDQVGGGSRRGLAARLVRIGVLRSTRTEAGGALRDVPAKILTLTEAGQVELERMRDVLLPYNRDPYRIRQDRLRHDQLAQEITMHALRDGSIVDFKTEREMSHISRADVKQPDIVWGLKNGQNVAVEIELTGKWGRDLDHFVLACVQSVNPSHARFDLLTIVTDSPAIQRRYLAAFAPGTSLNLWGKNARGHWQTVRETKVPDWIKGKMVCKLIGGNSQQPQDPDDEFK